MSYSKSHLFKMRHKIYSIVIIACLLALSLTSCIYPYDVYYTTDINDYYSKKTNFEGVWKAFFMEELPEEAEVVSFTYYQHFSDILDIDLELKFNNPEALQAYIKKLLDYCTEFYSDREMEIEFFETKNSDKPSYTELYDDTWAYWRDDGQYAGYYIDQFERYECQYAIISYSLEELTVIQSVASGFFRPEEYIPKYISRYNTQTDLLSERLVKVKEK